MCFHGEMDTKLLIVDVANVLKSDITSAFTSDTKDYEDAVQASVGAIFSLVFQRLSTNAVSPPLLTENANARASINAIPCP